MLGLSDEATPIIEQSTVRLYRILNAHFLEHPYILGGSPSIADFGLMAPIHAHLGRDPSSNSELKLVAPALYRWIETMDRMSPAELDQYGSILHAAGCEAIFALQLERAVVRDDYTYVLA
jgi:glutathione S-transferase